MKEINRFYIMGNKLPSDDGSIVNYKDHTAIVAEKDARIAALQEQVRALVADNANLKSACGGDGSYVDCPGCSHSQYTEAPETPATDAAIREIRADGAMACGVHLREWYDYQVEERAEEFAAAILAGEQP